MVSRRRWLTPAAVAVGCLLAGWGTRAQDQPAPPDPFRGQYLSVIKRSDPSYAISLERARIQTLGEARFLVGVAADDGVPDNWQVGLTVWVALDDVSEMAVFPTIEDLRDAMGALDDRIAGRGGPRLVPAARPAR